MLSFSLQSLSYLLLHLVVLQVAPNLTSAHYKLVTMGALHSNAKGAHLLLHTTECMCLNQSECKPPGTPLYEWTHQVRADALAGYFTGMFGVTDPSNGCANWAIAAQSLNARHTSFPTAGHRPHHDDLF